MAFPAPLPVPTSPQQGPLWARRAQAEDSVGEGTWATRCTWAEKGRMGEGLVRGSGWSWGSGVGRGLTSSLTVPGVSCTEDAAVVCWAGVDICKRDP